MNHLRSLQLNYFYSSYIIGAMKDLIQERNEREKMEHSIVKWWNVHYMTPEELRAAQQAEKQESVSAADVSTQPGGVTDEYQQLQTAEEELHAAEEILERLEHEAKQDEMRKREEIEQVKREAEANYNPTTGAYSGVYGQTEVTEEDDGQIQSILSEKDEALRDLIKQTEEE